jgi:hypothetical protein
MMERSKRQSNISSEALKEIILQAVDQKPILTHQLAEHISRWKHISRNAAFEDFVRPMIERGELELITMGYRKFVKVGSQDEDYCS